MRVHQQPAFVLLNRPFSESSWITELFCRDFGRLAVIAKGARRFKSPFRGVLLPFQPLLVSWSGRGEVPTLTGAEIKLGKINLFECDLHGDALICAFYCNELITYLLHRHDPHPRLFDAYQLVLTELYKDEGLPEQSLSSVLRRFERRVISDTGYEVDFEYEADRKTLILPDQYYRYVPGDGFYRCEPTYPKALLGNSIVGLRMDSADDRGVEETSQGKQLMRVILAQSLGYRKIVSRGLFVRTYHQ